MGLPREVLSLEGVPLVTPKRRALRRALGARDGGLARARATPAFTRAHFKRTDAPHPALAARPAARFVLRFCVRGIGGYFLVVNGPINHSGLSRHLSRFVLRFCVRGLSGDGYAEVRSDVARKEWLPRRSRVTAI